MDGCYKYDPDDYIGLLNVYEDMSLFYALLEKHRSDKTIESRLALEKHSQDFFFTIKHREIEGQLAHAVAEEMRDYLREQLHD